MRIRLWTTTTLVVMMAAAATLTAARASEIPKGAHVLLRIDNSLSTRTAQEGDTVYFRTASPIADAGRMVVPEGSYVQGVVAHARRSGRVTGRAELAIRLETMTLASGRVVKVSPKVAAAEDGESGQKVEGQEGNIRQAPQRGQDVARVAILAGSGASLGGLADRGWRGAGIGGGAGMGVGLATVLLSRGREVELRRGMTLDVVFDRPVALDE